MNIAATVIGRQLPASGTPRTMTLMLSDYIANTATTAIYPHVDTGSLDALVYLALGLAGESTEALDAAAHHELSELGDVAWYLARLSAELGIDVALLDAVCNHPVPRSDGPTGVADLVIVCGRFAELVKKAIRDDSGELTAQRRSALVDQVITGWQTLNQVAHSLGHSLDTLLRGNAEKLARRAAANTLMGSGDNR